jgi:hypothetical protein
MMMVSSSLFTVSSLWFRVLNESETQDPGHKTQDTEVLS